MNRVKYFNLYKYFMKISQDLGTKIFLIFDEISIKIMLILTINS